MFCLCCHGERVEKLDINLILKKLVTEFFHIKIMSTGILFMSCDNSIEMVSILT